MWRKALLLTGVLLAALVQLLCLVDLVAELAWLATPTHWLFVYLVSGAMIGLSGGRLLDGSVGFCLLLTLFSLFIPVAGSLGGVLAVAHAQRQSLLSRVEPAHWTITRRAELPFTTPTGRQLTRLDNRGFTEQLLYSRDNDDLYRKVLAAGNIKVSLSVSALKQALRHADERIRLTAFKTLDRRVTELNKQIQSLEARVADDDRSVRSHAWMQIASNYWELLALEESEPVARQQLLHKASQAAIQAVAVTPGNRNAHFLLGQVALQQGDLSLAGTALERARSLGMPADKVVPYLAEAAFKHHDFRSVRALMNKLDPAIKAYPPLSDVARYWT